MTRMEKPLFTWDLNHFAISKKVIIEKGLTQNSNRQASGLTLTFVMEIYV